MIQQRLMPCALALFLCCLLYTSKSLRAGAGYGEVRWDAEIINQDGAVVASYDVLTMVSERAIPDQVA